jgi:hypothetical protein
MSETRLLPILKVRLSARSGTRQLHRPRKFRANGFPEADMTVDEILDVKENSRTLLKDGKVGVLIGYPTHCRAEALIQVPGEAEPRELLPSQMLLHGDILLEDGASLDTFMTVSAAT